MFFLFIILYVFYHFKWENASFLIIKSDLQKIKKARTLIKMFSLDSFITDVSIFCLRSRHSNRRSYQCIFFCTFFMSKSLFSIKTKCLKKCLKSRIFTLLVVVATLHTPHAVSVELKRFGWTWIRHVSLTNSHIQRFGLTVQFRRNLLTLRQLYHGRKSASTLLMSQLVQAVILPQHVMLVTTYTMKQNEVCQN